MDYNDSSTNRMTPKEIDESFLGMSQEIEPTLPKKLRKNQFMSKDPLSGEPIVMNSKEKKEKGKSKETKKQKREAKQQAFWDSIL